MNIKILREKEKGIREREGIGEGKPREKRVTVREKEEKEIKEEGEKVEKSERRPG